MQSKENGLGIQKRSKLRRMRMRNTQTFTMSSTRISQPCHKHHVELLRRHSVHGSVLGASNIQVAAAQAATWDLPQTSTIPTPSHWRESDCQKMQ